MLARSCHKRFFFRRNRSVCCVGGYECEVIGVAAIAQLGERQTEDLKVPGSIPGLGIFLIFGVSAGAARVVACRSARCFDIGVAGSSPWNVVRRMRASMMRQWAHSFHRLLGLVV